MRGSAGAFEAALDEWFVLTGVRVGGDGAAAHEIVCGYAAERRAFGGVIGSYQGVAHPLAEDATRLDGARLLVQKAAWALDTHHARSRELAALAFAFASETAEQATYDAIHFHGGYGFMLEHDVQLYYRRARGWARVWGSAERCLRAAPPPGHATDRSEQARVMDFAWDAEAEVLRVEVRDFLHEHLTPELEEHALRVRGLPRR